MSRVLVVEDSPTQAQQFAFILEDSGFDVETTPDAERGIERLVAGQFNVVLSDLHLPGDSGFDLCRRIKADPDLRHIPIVVCTSEADPVNVLRGLEAGADGFMTKDRDPAEIVGVIRRVLARPASPGDAPVARVAFFDQQFELTVGREQLLDILVSAFEDVVHLNRRSLAGAAALRDLNVKLQTTNRQLESSRDHLDGFFRIATSLQDPNNFEKTFDLVLHFCQQLGYDLAMLSLVDPEAGVIRGVRAAGSFAEILNQTVRPLDSDDILAVVVREKKTFVIPDCDQDSRCDQATVTASGLRGMIALPLISGEVIGTLQVASSSSLDPTPEDLRTLETLGTQAARALSGLFRLQEIRRLNQELEQRNQRLQQLADELAEAARSERQALEELKRAETQLVQAEKLSALGQMVAGVAHEINNPLAFVTNNVAVLQRDIGFLLDVFRLYQEGDPTLAEFQSALFARIRARAEDIDLAYTIEHLQGMITRSGEGLKRIQEIVKNLRHFARLDESDLKEADLNTGIVSTLDLVRGEAERQEITIEEHLSALPKLTCYSAKINQVVLNLVANAIEACSPGGKVTVSSRPVDQALEVEVADTGHGIELAIRDKIFDPFFTTKPIGKGTGLGLSISYGIVQEHGGTIVVESEPGKGTKFTVHFPLDHVKTARSAAREPVSPAAAPSTTR